MICPPDHQHGASNVCYVKHSCRCDDCTLFNTEYAYWRRYQKESLTVDSEPYRRKLRALHALGWTRPMLAHESGAGAALYQNVMYRRRVHRTTARLIDAQYERLSMRLPAPSTSRERADSILTRRRARAKGWLPPLAWDDIEAGLAA